MKVYCSNDFTGFWPVGTAAIVVAPDFETAALLIEKELGTRHLKWGGTLKEVQTENAQVIILNDGVY